MYGVVYSTIHGWQSWIAMKDCTKWQKRGKHRSGVPYLGKRTLAQMAGISGRPMSSFFLRGCEEKHPNAAEVRCQRLQVEVFHGSCLNNMYMRQPMRMVDMIGQRPHRMSRRTTGTPRLECDRYGSMWGKEADRDGREGWLSRTNFSTGTGSMELLP